MRFAPALAALVVLAALAGCSPVSTEPEPPPPGRGWAQPALAFESEEAALAAATEFYAKVVQAGAAIGADPNQLRLYSTPAYFESQVEAYNALADKGQRLSGTSTVLEVRLQQWDRNTMTIYACHDFSGVRLLDNSGKDVTPEDRPDIATFEVGVVLAPGSRLLIESSELWSHGSKCF